MAAIPRTWKIHMRLSILNQAVSHNGFSLPSGSPEASSIGKPVRIMRSIRIGASNQTGEALFRANPITSRCGSTGSHEREKSVRDELIEGLRAASFGAGG
jgi:hypothetical protein